MKRELTFIIYPREIIELEIYVTDCLTNLSLDLKHYKEFKNGDPLQYSPPFALNKENLLTSIDRLYADIWLVIETDLKYVVENKEWITIPTFDPRDVY